MNPLTKPVQFQYENLLIEAYRWGKAKGDRTGTGTTSVFGHQLRYDLKHGFPLITTKRVSFKMVLAELLWLLSGSTNVRGLQAMGCNIWNQWADETGELGPVYGKQWRDWTGGHDQITALIDGIRKNPNSRRHVVSCWNVDELPDESLSPQQNVAVGRMALAPCHTLFQFDVTQGKLSCQLYQRSADLFLGVPFNIASYALLTHMVAQQCNLEVGDFIWNGGDCHIYSNHRDQVATQLSRTPFPFPELSIKRRPASIFDYTMDDFEVVGYQHHPAIKAPIAI
jgi:thymidylate synthase